MKKITTWAAVFIAGFLLGGLVFYAIKASGRLPFGAPAGSPGRAGTEMKHAAGAFSGIVKTVSPSVVNIASKKLRGAGSEEGGLNELLDEFFSPFYDFQKNWSEHGLGSGVIVSPEGYIVTNYHVIEDSEEIRVTLYDRKTLRGELVGADPKTDLAVLKIEAKGLPVAAWGNSDNLQVGEFVLAIGNPFSLSHTVTMGIISAVGRADVGIADYEDFIQTDAAINPGNSGGPLVNEAGEVIGINTAIFTKSGGYQGIGFAVPSNMARLVMSQLIGGGKVVRGWLGITMQELTPEISPKFGAGGQSGALVSDVLKGSPAMKAGLRRGDIILEFNGLAVKDPPALKNLAAQAKPGSKVALGILRGSQSMRVEADMGEYPGDSSQAVVRPLPRITPDRGAFSGLNVTGLTKDIIKQLGLPPEEKGVVVVGVQRTSPAAEAGLRRGDIIEEIDRRPVGALDDFNRLASAAPGVEDTALLLVNRAGKRFYIALKR